MMLKEKTKSKQFSERTAVQKLSALVEYVINNKFNEIKLKIIIILLLMLRILIRAVM